MSKIADFFILVYEKMKFVCVCDMIAGFQAKLGNSARAEFPQQQERVGLLQCGSGWRAA